MKAEDLKRLRERLDITQAELARRLKVDVMTVSRWERGVIEIPGPVEVAMETIKAERERSQGG